MTNVIIPFVTPERWAEIACMDGAGFGVKETCSPCDFYLNACARRELALGLIGAQVRTENELGFDLTPKYRYEEIPWDGTARIQVGRHAIGMLNVIERQKDLDDSPFDVSPYIATEVVPTGDFFICVSSDILKNPQHAIIRDHSDGGVIEQAYDDGYPHRDADGDWVIKLEDIAASVDIQHCKYMTVTIATPDCTTNNCMVFAYAPGTNVYIPFAREPVQNETTGETTYFFYAWSMVDPSFRDDECIDLVAGEFYKLLTQVAFATTCPFNVDPIVMREREGCHDEFYEDAETDLIITRINDSVIDIFQASGVRCTKTNPLRIGLYYRTNPDLVQRVDWLSLEKAIVGLVASEMPLRNCNCEQPEYGYVWSMQQSYGDVKINQVTGTETIVVKFGAKEGQVQYGQALEKAPKLKGLFVP